MNVDVANINSEFEMAACKTKMGSIPNASNGIKQ